MLTTLFVLGGNDGEMELIKQLLSQFGQRWIQPNLAWGNHVYSVVDLGLEVEVKQVPWGGDCGRMEYRNVEEIKAFDKLVFIECRPKGAFYGAKVMEIDHHGPRSGEAASVTQLVSILRLDFSLELLRWVELVAANDVGYIPAMLAIGATAEEINRVRLFDRSAQGITPAQEAAAEEAIAGKTVDDRLTVVHLDHSKTATVTDRLFGQYDQLLVLSNDGEANFFGDGALCANLKEKFEGWNGGSGLGNAGGLAYWGGYPKHEEVLAFIRQSL